VAAAEADERTHAIERTRDDNNRTGEGLELIQEVVDGSGWGWICTGEEEKVLVLVDETHLAFELTGEHEHEQHGKNR